MRLEQLCQRFPLGSQFASEHTLQSAVPRFYLDHGWIWQGQGAHSSVATKENSFKYSFRKEHENI